VTVLDVSDTLLADAISPELVLVSQPEVAQLARAQLPTFPTHPVSAPRRAERGTSPRRIEFIAAYVVCLLVTLGPLGFIIFSQPIHPGP
jgi:hypothetical protein